MEYCSKPAITDEKKAENRKKEKFTGWNKEHKEEEQEGVTRGNTD